MTHKAFRPLPGATVLIDVGGTTARILLYPQRREIQVYVFNDGSATAWIAFGDATVVASATADMAIGTKQGKVFTILRDEASKGPTYAAAIAAGSTGKLYFTPGEGGL